MRLGQQKAAHCGKQGRSKVPVRGEGRELGGMVSSGSAWSLPGGEKTHYYFCLPLQCTLKQACCLLVGLRLNCQAHTRSAGPEALSPVPSPERSAG